MSFKGWERVNLETAEGRVSAIAPLIVSASRATDIPAFYGEWLCEQMERGFVTWTNPFNRQRQYVSFAKTRLLVFWTKNPQPLLPLLPYFDAKGIDYYFHFTLNDYEQEGLEPKVPPLTKRLDTFAALSEQLGKERVIWRFDPLLLTQTLGAEGLLEKIHKVGTLLHPYTQKLVISFADIEAYPKVRQNLAKAQVRYREFSQKEVYRIAKGLQEINKNWRLEITTCAENWDLSAFQIEKNRCIDEKLLLRLFPQNKELMDFLGHSFKEIPLFSNLSDDRSSTSLKDKGQRSHCGCIVSKDIGQYNTCRHFCQYCYANSSLTEVRAMR